MSEQSWNETVLISKVASDKKLLNLRLSLIIIFLGLLLNHMVFNTSLFVRLINLLIHALAFGLCVAYGRLRKKHLIFLSISLLLILLPQPFQDSETLSIAILLIPVFYNVESKEISRIYFFTIALSMLVIMGLYYAQIIPVVTSMVDGVARPLYGFYHCNIAAAVFVSTLLALFHFRFQRHNLLDYTYGIFIFGMTYFVLYSRTSAIIVLLIMIAMVGSQFIQPSFNHRTFNRLLEVLFILVLLASIGYIVVTSIADMDLSWMQWLNQVTTTRVELNQSAFSYFGFPLFPVTGGDGWHGNYLMLDSGIYAFIANYGSIGFILFIILLVAYVHRSIKGNTTVMVYIWAILLIQATVENMFFDLFFNPMLLMFLAIPLTDVKRYRDER